MNKKIMPTLGLLSKGCFYSPEHDLLNYNKLTFNCDYLAQLKNSRSAQGEARLQPEAMKMFWRES